MARSWNITQRLLDQALRHRRLLLLVENRVVRDMAAVFRDAERDLAGRIVALLGDRDPDAWLTGARQARLLAQLQAELNETYQTLHRTVNGALKEQAKAEADIVLGRLDAALAQLPEDIPVFRPSARQLEQLVTHGLPKDTTGEMQQLDETIEGLKPAAQKRLNRAFQGSVIQGDGSAKIARSVSHALGVSQNEAVRLARTMIQRVSNDAARLAYSENQHLVGSTQWMASLDDRTCALCGANDGRIYDVSEMPILPAHYLCRCFLAPVVKSWRELGIPASKANDDIRRLFDGEPAARETYAEWLDRQPAGTQKEILGAARYEAYRDGSAKIDDFATDRRVLTVAEWKERAA